MVMVERNRCGETNRDVSFVSNFTEGRLLQD